jgi:hypothetical protein
MKAEDRQPHTARKMLAFALLLSVPVALTGCSTYDDCDPNYETCNTGGGSGGAGGYYRTGGGSTTAPDTSAHASGSSSHSGFGSGGGHSVGG